MVYQLIYHWLKRKLWINPPILAALAQPMNGTELQVLQCLFSLADVNSKVTQYVKRLKHLYLLTTSTTTYLLCRYFAREIS